ncbi:dienelactone hydrolase [Desulfoluna limicola]|uniref:Dienelactone hydrolase n=1 Tax=Desulfoluna limicola TaxID=2810562 RepID=A0ABM7PCU2_9BACT|nr:dienelactone hydrolase family protein [Desulfoluna limicola]BCS94966.1 dienelactone hydrolase [Desulfoluna limicola]
MTWVVVSDIFGRTPALETLCRELADKAEIVDPYGSRFMDFENEADAYACFMETLGVDAYASILASCLSQQPPDATLLGFSVGASAIWQLSGNLLPISVERAVCFYGSQIRHSTDINPPFPIDIILPEREEHFSVSALSEALSSKPKVTIHQSTYLHGFMNPHSTNFDSGGYTRYLGWLSMAG